MGHCIQYEDYKEKVDRKKVQTDWNNYVSHTETGYQEGTAGLPNQIRWLDSAPIQKNREEAEKYIKRNDSGWYDQVAVRYYAVKDIKDLQSEKTKDLYKKYNDIMRKRDDMRSAFYYKDAKSKYIACKGCGSKLNISILGKTKQPNYCPLCGLDLRPQSFQEKDKKLSDAIEKYKKKVIEEREMLEKKAKKEIRWLVKVEYHC